MKFAAQSLAGLWLITPERRADERGYFGRTYCAEEFARQGLPVNWPQHNESHNLEALTLRGLHWQAAPHGEAKVVRCGRGRIFDVVVDLRTDSDSCGQWAGFDLSAENGWQLFIPEGFAHGFLTLAPATTVCYLMSTVHVSAAARGVRWNDPVLGIRWPAEPRVISERDRSFSPYAGSLTR